MYLNHPNIIKMYGYFDDEKNIYIILEVGTGGQLYHYLKKSQTLPEAKVAFLMKQICDAVNEIHSLRIIHRDIKPENIVLHDVTFYNKSEHHQTLRFRMECTPRQQVTNNILRYSALRLPLNFTWKIVR